MSDSMQDYAEKYAYMELSTIPKYRKKAKKKRVVKAKHKHITKQVLMLDEFNNISLAEVCNVCGKIVTHKCVLTQKCAGGFYRVLTTNEILQKYKDIPMYSYNIRTGKYRQIE